MWQAFDDFQNQPAGLPIPHMQDTPRYEKMTKLQEAWSRNGVDPHKNVDILLSSFEDQIATTMLKTFSTEEYGALEAMQAPTLQSEGSKRVGTFIKTQQAGIGTLPREVTAEMCHFLRHHELGPHEEFAQLWANEGFAVSPHVPSTWEHSLHYVNVYVAAGRCNMPKMQKVVLEKLIADGLKMPDVNKGLKYEDMGYGGVKLKSRERAGDWSRALERIGAKVHRLRHAVWQGEDSCGGKSCKQNGRGVPLQPRSQGIPFEQQIKEIDEVKSALRAQKRASSNNVSASTITSHSLMFRLIDKLYSSGDGLLTETVLRFRGNKILQMKDNEELNILRSKHPSFHQDLHRWLVIAAQDYEEVVENEHGNWTLRLREVGKKLKAKL
jgi:hypothetical protein